MKFDSRLKIALVAITVPLVVTACFSSTPTRQGSETGKQSGSESSSSRSGSGSSNPSQLPSASPSTGSASRTGSTSPPGSSQGHRGVPGTSQSTTPGGLELPSESQSDGESGNGSSSDIRVATADSRAPDGRKNSESKSGDSADAGDENGQRDVSVAEALEGANAAVDAAAGAVAEAEATIAKAKEEAETGGNGQEDNFDPWAKPGSDASTESQADGEGNPDATVQTEEKETGQQQTADAQDDSFDPFATYNDEQEPGAQRIPRSSSLETADNAVAQARAALNRARRSLINAASTGDGDADAEAVQLGAARAAMDAAAEAVIASAIAVMAASDAFAEDDEQYDAEAAEARQAEMAKGIEMVVDITNREMNNAADALEATGELLSAAASLIGILAGTGETEDPGDKQNAGVRRVASLEEKLDQSLSVFDDRMEAEGRMAGNPNSTSHDSETAGLPMGEKSNEGNRSGGSGKSKEDGDNSASGTDDTVNDVDVRYESPERMGGVDIEDQFIDVRAQDDDIVARQLREAAMAETDPQLREALWREYKNYKESLESGEAEASQ